MIKNLRQYKITKNQKAKLEEALHASLNLDPDRNHTHPILIKAQIEALRSQIDDLQKQISEYDALVSGQNKETGLETFGDLPKALIRARISGGLSQKQLAERLGIKEQQVQRYEATEYAAASLSRVRQIIDALELKIDGNATITSTTANLTEILKNVSKLGIDKYLIFNRIAPNTISSYIDCPDLSSRPGGLAGPVLQLVTSLSNIYGWTSESLLAGAPLAINEASLGGVKFKVSSVAEQRHLTAYTVYSHYLALLLLETTKHLPQHPIPSNSEQIIENILLKHKTIDYCSVLDYVWSLGIPVLPLNDAGAFHGACWRVEGRNVIVLKQRTKSQSRWLFDLVHELYHASKYPELKDRAIIDSGDDFGEAEEEEEEASTFAGNIILQGRAEELVDLCVKEAQGRIEHLKTAVQRISNAEHVSIDALSNYIAFRLSMQNINWWGTAANLQTKGNEPFEITRERLLNSIDLTSLNELDRNLILNSQLNEMEYVL